MRYIKVLFLLIAFLFSTNYIKAQACITPPSDGTDNQIVCINSPIKNIIYTLGPGVTGAALSGQPGGVTGVYSLGFFTISGTPAVQGNFNYTVTVTTTGICTPPDHANGKMTVNDLPSITGTTPNSRCGPGVVFLGATASAGTVNWYNVSTGGVPIGTGNSFTTPIIFVTTTYYVDATANGCTTPTRTSIVATVLTTPPPTGSTTQNFCAINNPTVANLTATGTGIQWYLTSNGGVALVATTPLSTRYYYASQTVGGCESTSRLAVSVTVNDPSTPTGITPQNFCAINNPTVANLVASGTGIQWYLTPTGGTVLASSTPLATDIYYASQTLGGCESTSRFALSVTVSNPAAPSGTTPQNFCAINNPTVANLVATGTSIKWYLAAIGGTALVETTPLSTRNYYASQTIAGCESISRQTVFVIVNNPPAPTGPSTQSFCTINNPTVANLVVSGTGIQWYLTPTGGIALASSTPLATNTYYASQTIGICESSTRLAVAVTVNNPPAPTGPATQNFCIADNPTVANLIATGINIKWYLVPTGGMALSSITPIVTGNYYSSQTVGDCESSLRLVVAVTVNNPSAPTGVSPQNFCLINNPTVASLVATGTGIKWYLTSTGGTVLATTTPLETRTYYASQTVGSCESPLRLTVVVTINNPPAPSGVSPQNFCSNNNPTVANIVATGTGIRWYLTPTGGTPLETTAPLVTSAYYASQTIGVCESSTRLPIAVTVNQSPVATAANNGPVCVGSTLNLTGGPASMTTYSWTGPNGYISNQMSPVAPSATLAMAGIYTLTVTSSTGCQDTATTRAWVYTVPISNAGAGGTECDLNFVLNAVPSVGIGLWTMVTGPGTASFTPNANSPAATVTVSVYGTYTFRWTETNGPCISSSAVTVNFYQRPVVNPGPSGFACNLNYSFNAVNSVGIGTWTMTSGTGTATFSPNANTPTATVLVSEYGTKQFKWTEVNGPCSDDSTITINFYAQPSANAGTEGNNCGTDFNLRAIPSIGIGTWTRDSGPGTATFTPDANQPNAKVSVTTYGTYIFKWTEVNGSCSSSATVSVNFIQQPPANAGHGGDECDLNFTLNAVPGIETGTWTKASGPGNATFIPNPNQYNAVVTVTQFGTYDFAWTETNSICSTTDAVRVVFHDLPSVNAGADALLCRGRSIQLNAIGTGTTFLWSPANLLNNPNISNPVATPATTTTFIVTLTDQFGCKNSDQVNIEVRVQPIANAGPDQVLEYLFETDMKAAAPGTNQTGEWTLLTGRGKLSDITSPSPHVTDLGIDVNSFIWSVTNGVCPVSSDTVNIVVHDLIIPTLITPNLDGINDFFVIQGVETFGNTTLIVFNRWGARVYENNKYDNSWNGVDDNQNPLPDDIYFFVLKPEKGRIIKGYVVIRR